VNLYNVLDNELERMHKILHTFIAATNGSDAANANIAAVYQRVAMLQDKLLLAVDKHDALIQEKVAELAFTGERNDKV
jgi:hypothetical protein